MNGSSFYPLFQKTKLARGISHPDIFMIWVGGIDFVYQLSRKKKGIQLRLLTQQPMFQFLSGILSHHLIEVYSAQDLPSSARLAMSGGGAVFCVATKGSTRETFHVERVQTSSLVLNGRTHSMDTFGVQWDVFQLHIIENPHRISAQEITLSSLSRFSSRYKNVLEHLNRWLLLLRRASMRNNWKDLLRTREGYFLLATQTYQQLSNPQGANREKFVSCLSQCSLLLHKGRLAKAAQDFRHSSQQWQRLSEVLISFDDQALQEASLLIRLKNWTADHSDRLCRQFVCSKKRIDLGFRLEVLENTLRRIIAIEAGAINKIEEGLKHLNICSRSVM
jgi:hypothetical protein